MKVIDAVAKRISKLLLQNNMTAYRLERESGLPPGSVGRILARINKTVTLTTIYKLARGFNMTFHEFLDDDVFRSDELEID